MTEWLAWTAGFLGATLLLAHRSRTPDGSSEDDLAGACVIEPAPLAYLRARQPWWIGAGALLVVAAVAGTGCQPNPDGPASGSDLPPGAEALPADLAVSFTFTPAAVTPGEIVSLHLSPPWPVSVEFGGRPLAAEITNGGRTLIVAIPSDAPGGDGFLELVAGTRRSRASEPLRIVGTSGPAYGEAETRLAHHPGPVEAAAPLPPAATATASVLPRAAAEPHEGNPSAGSDRRAGALTAAATGGVLGIGTIAAPPMPRAPQAETRFDGMLAAASPPASARPEPDTTQQAAVPLRPAAQTAEAGKRSSVTQAKPQKARRVARAKARVRSPAAERRAAKAEKRAARARARAQAVARAGRRDPCKRAYLPLDLVRCVAGRS